MIKLPQNITSQNNNFGICVRAVIQQNGKILVCKEKGKNYYFLPGGHLEFGEKAQETLFRELKEELNVSLKKCKFIGVVENVYVEDSKTYHEINLVFETEVDKIFTQSQEDHIEFLLVEISKFSKMNVLPIALKKMVLKWLKDKKPFFATQFYNKTITEVE